MSIPETLAKLKVPISGLRPYQRNPRNGDLDVLKDSLQRHSQYRPIVVRARTNEILAGNHTYMAAMELGWQEIAATFVDVDDDEAARIVLVDNRSNDLAKYDDGLLADLLQSLPDLAGTGYGQDDLAELLAKTEGPQEGLTDPDDVPAPPAEAITKPGDLWLLGDHRLLCGDSSVATDLDRLYGGETVGVILTDPPYGISLDTDYSKRENTSPGTMKSLLKNHPRRNYRAVAGDEGAFDASFLSGYFHSVAEQFWFGADYYRRTLSAEDRDGSWLVWDKRSPETDTVLGSGFELVWSKEAHKRDLLRHFWSGAFGSGAVDGCIPLRSPRSS